MSKQYYLQIKTYFKMKKVLLIAIAMMTTLVTASAQNGTGCTKQQADGFMVAIFNAVPL